MPVTHRAVRTTIGVLVGLTVAACAHAKVPDLVTDQPGQTESPTVVRRGSFQVETR